MQLCWNKSRLISKNDETIVKVKEQTEKQKKTAVGTKFIDFEMQTPEGKNCETV